MPADAVLVSCLVLGVFAFFACVMVYADLMSQPPADRNR